MPSTTFTITRDGEDIELDIEYELATYYPPSGMCGPPEFSDPGESGEVEELTATRDGKPFDLTDAERHRIETHIYETHNYAEDSGHDPDDYL